MNGLLGRRKRHHPRALLDKSGHEHVAEPLGMTHEKQTNDEPREGPGSGWVGRHLRLGLANQRFGEMIQDPDRHFWSSSRGVMQDC